MIRDIDYLGVAGVAMAGSAATIASLFVGFFLFFLFFGKANSKSFIEEFNFFQILQIVSLAMMSALPIRWFLGYLGSDAAGFIWVVLIIAGVIAFINSSSGWRDIVKFSAGSLAFFSLTAFLFYGAWYQPSDLFIGDPTQVVSITNQGDLWPQIILNQMFAYGKEYGFYSSPIGYPAKLTFGSYLATLWSGVNSQLATFGNSGRWSVSLMRLGLFFLFQMTLLSIINIFIMSVHYHKIRTLDFFKSHGVTLLLVLSSLNLVATFVTWDAHYISTFFIHSLNNGAGCTAILSLIASGIILGRSNNLPPFKVAMFFLFITPAIVFSRVNWIAFIYPLACTFAIYPLVRSGNKTVRINVINVIFNKLSKSDLAVAGISITLFLSALFVFGKFAFPIAYPGVIVGFNSTLQESYSGFLTYHGWYPNYSRLVKHILSLGNSAGYFSPFISAATWKLTLCIVWQLILCVATTMVWFSIFRHWILTTGFFLSLMLLSFLMFVVKPLGNGEIYGSTEPLGHALILIFFLLSVGIIVISGKALQKETSIIRWFVGVLIIFLSIGWGKFGLESSYANKVTLKHPSLLHEVRKICSENTKGIYSNNEVFDALSGCVSVGEYRYSIKLSNTDERKEFQSLGRDVCKTLKPGTYTVQEINGKQMLIVRL